MNDDSFLPSRDLVRLGRGASVAQVQHGLGQVADALGASKEAEIYFDCQVTDRECAGSAEREINDDADSEEGADDAGHDFEMRIVRAWLTRIVASNLDWIEHEQDDAVAVAIDKAVSRAAELLAVCAGKSASGRLTVRYVFTTGPTSAVSVRSQEATLTDDALGGRTWGAAPLLVQHLLKDETLRRRMLERVGSNHPLRILELGAGTGLVGLAVALHLGSTHAQPTSEQRSSSDTRLHLVLTDHHPTVLANLSANVGLNGMKAESNEDGRIIQVRRLDWQATFDAKQHTTGTSSYSSRAQTLPQDAEAGMDPTWTQPLDFGDASVDIILAADCVYDPLHPSWIRAVAEKYLRRPDGKDRGGTLHMISPLRSTHVAEMEAIDDAFPRAADSASGKGELSLRTTAVEQVRGHDHFGPPRLKLGPDDLRQGDSGIELLQTTYRRFEMQWIAS